MSQETTVAEQLARYVDMCVPGATAPKISAELRRLAALNAQLLEALKAAVECRMAPVTSATDGGAAKFSRQVEVADMIRAAIAEATEGGAS